MEPNKSSADNAVAQLRAEVISAQTARTGFLRYKLLVCAVVGAVAVGTGPGTASGRVPYVVGLLPLVCIYIDAICAHNDLRILVIGRFLLLSGESTALQSYERFAGSLRGVFGLEALALAVSTRFISGGIFLVGLGRALFTSGDRDVILIVIEISSGLFGVVTSLALNRRLGTLATRIAESEEPQ